MMQMSLMKFFTRQLVRRSQSDRFTARDWLAVENAYRSHIAEISRKLSPSARLLSRLYFHDCVVQRIEFDTPTTLVLQLKGFKHDRAGKNSVPGVHRLAFTKVAMTNVAMEHLSQYWSYEEIHAADDAMELRVLLGNGKQFRVRFHGVKVQTAADGRSKRGRS